jgi:hypothetical protein
VIRSQESGVRSQESGVRSQESGVRSQESGVPSVSIPTGLRIKAQGCSAQRGYPGNQVFHTTYPNRGCEIMAHVMTLPVEAIGAVGCTCGYVILLG